MTKEILVPENHDASRHRDNPYTHAGASNIVRWFRSDVLAMMNAMVKDAQDFEGGKTFLAHSPLRKKVYVAAALKTLGMVTEHPSATGACALKLTDVGREYIDHARSLGLME